MADNRATLKAFFETGDIPTQAQFAALIDGLVSVVDADTITGIKTHDANIIIADSRTIKALNGGGELTFRLLGINGAVFFTSDNLAFDQAWMGVQPTVSAMGFGLPASALNNSSSIEFRPNSIKLIAETTGGVSGSLFEIFENKMGFFKRAPIVQPAAIPDTSGATLVQLEDEVNKIKAVIRSLGFMAN